LRKIYKVLKHGTNHFTLADHIAFVPTGQVIADSDALAFIYIVEEDEQYSYLTFGQELWIDLLVHIQKGQNPVIEVGDKSIVLDGMIDELTSLLFNIEGNCNYGESFVEAVEKIFNPILKDVE